MSVLHHMRASENRLARMFFSAAAGTLLLSTVATVAGPLGAQGECALELGFEGTRLLNDDVHNIAGPFDIDLAAGTYDITVISHDNHDTQVGVGTQPEESFYFTLDSGYISGVTNDIPDDQNTAVSSFTGQVIGDSSSITLHHISNADGINSLSPQSICFTSTNPTAPPAVTAETPAEEPAVEVLGAIEEAPTAPPAAADAAACDTGNAGAAGDDAAADAAACDTGDAGAAGDAGADAAGEAAACNPAGDGSADGGNAAAGGDAAACDSEDAAAAAAAAVAAAEAEAAIAAEAVAAAEAAAAAGGDDAAAGGDDAAAGGDDAAAGGDDAAAGGDDAAAGGDDAAAGGDADAAAGGAAVDGDDAAADIEVEVEGIVELPDEELDGVADADAAAGGADAAADADAVADADAAAGGDDAAAAADAAAGPEVVETEVQGVTELPAEEEVNTEVAGITASAPVDAQVDSGTNGDVLALTGPSDAGMILVQMSVVLLALGGLCLRWGHLI